MPLLEPLPRNIDNLVREEKVNKTGMQVSVLDYKINFAKSTVMCIIFNSQ